MQCIRAIEVEHYRSSVHDVSYNEKNKDEIRKQKKQAKIWDKPPQGKFVERKDIEWLKTKSE